MNWKEMVKCRKRHDKVVKNLAKELDAYMFGKGSPFDLLTKNGEFIEVKLCNGNNPRFRLSINELKIVRIFPDRYFVYFYYHGKRTIFKGSIILKWANSRSWSSQFMHSKIKEKLIQLSNKRMEAGF